MRLPGTLSIYIGRTFFMMCVVVFLACLAVVFVADLTELIRRASNSAGASFFDALVLALYKLPATGEVIVPFAVLVASLLAFNRLTRRNELIVARAAGISVWQFCAPACIAAAVFGVLIVAVYNPVAAGASDAYSRLEAEYLRGQKRGVIGNVDGLLWLRQSNSAGTAVINARQALERGLELHGVVVYQFDKADRFLTRVAAETAIYDEGRWRLEAAYVTGRSGEPAFSQTHYVDTSLSGAQVAESIASPKAISFWDLPVFIAIAERAGLSASRHRTHYHMLLAQPALFAVMVLVAAVCTPRLARMGQVTRFVLGGLAIGVALFLSNHLSRALGDNGDLPPIIAAWWPICFMAIASVSVLFYREDG